MPEKSMQDLRMLSDQESGVNFAHRDRSQQLSRLLVLALKEKAQKRVFQTGIGITQADRERISGGHSHCR